MFSSLSQFTSRYRIVTVVFWLAAAAALFLASPTLSEVGVTNESQFLPQDTPSATAHRLLREKFPATAGAPESTGVIVIHNGAGLNDEDIRRAKVIRDWLNSTAAPDAVSGITSIFENEALRSRLVSADQTTMLILVDFNTSPLSDAAKEAVTQIRDYLQRYHAGATIYLTGEIGFFHDLFDSVLRTIDRTTIVTVILVAILLIIIYRSPVAVLLPLAAIGCSFAVARGILGFMGAAGVDISTLADAYLVVVVFGVGTDYCLFIVSRFREELRQRSRDEALDHTMRNIGPVIAASAVTVMVAFLSLGVSRFGMNKTTGYALATGVAVTLIASLTLVPALISLFGRHLFWPARQNVTHREGRFGWKNIGVWVSQHPLITCLLIVIMLLLPYSALLHLNRSADIINQMPTSADAVRGYRLMGEHFPLGELAPVYLLVESPEADITSPAMLPKLTAAMQELEKSPGISRVDYYAAPAAKFVGLADQVRSTAGALGTPGGLAGAGQLRSLGDTLQQLALQYPGILSSQNFQQATATLQEIAVLSRSLASGQSAELMSKLTQLKDDLFRLADSFQGLAAEFNLEVETPFTASLRNTYFSPDRSVMRANLVLESEPYSAETIDTIVQLRSTVKEKLDAAGLKGLHSYIGGESATRTDIMLTNDADFGRVTGLSTAAILLVIIILLRSLLAPLYMVATVLLNYGATLGITTWVFLDVLKHDSMIYMLPIFIFVVLVALGADYNIFLVSRIREEAHRRPMREAVSHAVANTGGVITACGIILAGTFATLTTAPLQVVLQIGAAIAIGVLIDTFIVRALLVPALATLAGRWSWWPSRLFRELSQSREDRPEITSR